MPSRSVEEVIHARRFQNGTVAGGRNARGTAASHVRRTDRGRDFMAGARGVGQSLEASLELEPCARTRKASRLQIRGLDRNDEPGIRKR